jgi:YHS domain-containing protein
MRFTVLFFMLLSYTITGQNIDYNTKKGYAAEGYDVVAYFNNEAKEGNKKHTTTYDGVNYKFASEQNLNMFLKSPERYLPQYGGYCAYAVALKSKKVSIDPETFEIRDGKLYLFYNAWGTNTLKLWKQEQPEELVQKGDKNWNKIKAQ